MQLVEASLHFPHQFDQRFLFVGGQHIEPSRFEPMKSRQELVHHGHAGLGDLDQEHAAIGGMAAAANQETLL